MPTALLLSLIHICKEVEGENVSGGSFINCIYTYQNGKMVRLAGNLPIELDYDGGDHFSHEMTLSSGTDGYVYMVWTIDGGGTSYESNYYYTLKDGKWQEVAGFGSDFHPDIYISQDVFSSTGYTTVSYTHLEDAANTGGTSAVEYIGQWRLYRD